MWKFNKKLSKNIDILIKNKSKLQYEFVKNAYSSFKEFSKKTKPLVEESKNHSNSFLTKGISKKLLKSATLINETKELLCSFLYVDMSNQPPLTEKEIETFKRLNECWGDDNDEVYAKSTFHYLNN